MNEVITWFEIPSADFERAVHFYSAILDSKIRTGEFMGILHGFFDDSKGSSGGAVIHSTDATPSATGPLIYLRVGNLDDVVARGHFS